jgi:hypothetical protein
MNFEDAIGVHVQWKSKLSAFIAKPDQSLNAEAVASDTQCELGKWLHGEGRTHSRVPEFVKAESDHARFHNAAGDIVRKAQTGHSMTDEIALGSGSEYAAASNAVVGSLMKLKVKVKI